MPVLLLALGCAAPSSTPEPASGVTPAGAAPVASPAPEIAVHEDIDRLKQRLRLPEGAVAARWRVHRLGVANPRVPGPTDERLVAWVTVDPAQWDTVEALYGSSRPPRGPVRVGADEVDLLPSELREPREPDGSVLLRGPVFLPDEASGRGWRVGQILRVGDHGLWITAIST